MHDDQRFFGVSFGILDILVGVLVLSLVGVLALCRVGVAVVWREGVLTVRFVTTWVWYVRVVSFLPPMFLVSLCTVVNTSGSLISEVSLPVGLNGRLPVLALLELRLTGVAGLWKCRGLSRPTRLGVDIIWFTSPSGW